MTHTIAPGQTYRSNRLVPLGPARVRITEYQMGDASACAVDPDTGAHCVVLAEDLHPTAPTGDARHDGYTLTDDGSCTLCDMVKPDGHALRDHVMNVHPDDFCRLYHHQPCRAERAATEYLAEQRRAAR